jgi:hypothetical protein
LPCPARPRAAPRSREDEDPPCALLGRQRPPCPLQALAAWTCRLAEPEAGHHQAQELPGQARRRPRLVGAAPAEKPLCKSLRSLQQSGS